MGMLPAALIKMPGTDLTWAALTGEKEPGVFCRAFTVVDQPG
jgi:hypothetical protein